MISYCLGMTKMIKCDAPTRELRVFSCQLANSSLLRLNPYTPRHFCPATAVCYPTSRGSYARRPAFRDSGGTLMRRALVLVFTSDELAVATRYSFRQEIRDKSIWSLVSYLLSPCV